MTIANGNSIAVPFVSGNFCCAKPPNNGNIISHTFQYGSNAASSKDIVAISDESAKFVSSYCISNDNTNNIRYISVPITTSGDWAIELMALYTTATAHCCVGIGGASNCAFHFPSANKIMFLDSFSNNTSTTGTPLTANTWYKVKWQWISNVLKIFLNDVEQAISGAAVYTAITALRIGARSDNNNAMAGSIADVKIYTGTGATTLSAWLPLQGGMWDISGNGNHGTIVNSLNMQGTQDFYHYNLTCGFDKHTKSGSTYYVPYVSGSPVRSQAQMISDGYAFVSSHPAGKWHNGAETKIVVGWSGAAKDANGWPACSDSRFVTGAFKTQDGTIVTRANADPNEIFIRVTCAPVGYCKEVYPPTMPEVSLGDYVVLDISGIKCQNLIWYASNAEPTLDASVKLHKYINKTDFVTDDSTGELVYDHEDHIVTDF